MAGIDLLPTIPRRRNNGRNEPLADVGAETRPAPINVGAVGQSPYRVQQIDPHGDSVHMANKDRTKPAVSDKLGRGRIVLAA